MNSFFISIVKRPNKLVKQFTCFLLTFSLERYKPFLICNGISQSLQLLTFEQFFKSESFLKFKRSACARLGSLMLFRNFSALFV